MNQPASNAPHVPKKREKILIEEKEPSGVPLGGIGAGCIEFGRDGRFRNITINNNRTTDTRIPVSPGAFVAVRGALKGRVTARILQSESGLPFAAGTQAQFTTPDELGWQPLYPSALYGLRLDPLPLDVRWRAIATVIPYDLDASTLPLILMTVSFRNNGDLPIDVSAILNWENLCRCARDQFPEDRGAIWPVMMDIDQSNVPADEIDESQVPRIGLGFGLEPPYTMNSEGSYAVVAKEATNVDISYCSFNGHDPMELGEFWSNFRDAGNLGNVLSRSPKAHHGAVCCSATLDVNADIRFTFAISWHCPRFESGGTDLGNGYAIAYRNAIDVARRGMVYRQYFLSAVNNWQNRFLNSSLPRWLSKTLLNSNAVFSTNTLYTSSGRMAMFETPADPITTSVNRRLHTSLGSLLCFPEFEKMELVQIARAMDEDNPGRICHNMGKLSVHQPNHGRSQSPAIDVNSAFILMAYRNYLMTGHRAALDHVFPRIVEAVEYMVSLDHDRDGLPDHHGAATSYLPYALHGTGSYSAGLWIAALRAYTLMAQRLGKQDLATRGQDLMQKAIQRFEGTLWSTTYGYYRMYYSDTLPDDGMPSIADACNAGQLAGPWYSDFLCLGSLFKPERVRKAIEGMQHLLEVNGLVRNAVEPNGAPLQQPAFIQETAPGRHGWLNYNLAHYASAQIYSGHADRGLYSVQRTYDIIHAALGRPFNQPLEWDIDNKMPAGWGQERHMSGLAVWHTLYALQGLLLNVPDQILWICPNLPRNVNFLDAPLLTPVCLGSMRFKESSEPRYIQELEIAFESPVSIKTFVFRIPDNVEEVTVQLTSSVGPERMTHVIGFQGNRHLLQIAAKTSILVQDPVTIRVVQAPTQAAK